MPAIPFVSIDANDDSVDFGRFAAAPANMTTTTTTTTATATTTAKNGPRTLLLAPPSFAAHEEKLRALYTTYDRATSDLQMLDRLAAGFVSLRPAAYDVVLVLTDVDGAQRAEALQLLSRPVYATLVPAMAVGAQLRFQDGGRLTEAGAAREAILAGLVEADGVFAKPADEEAVVPLRLKKKTNGAAASTNGTTNGTSNGTANGVTNAQGKRPAVVLDLGEYSDGDELVDEDSLLSEEERNRPPQTPPECVVDGQKRRKPCKDCTCGLSERLMDEDRERRKQADKDLSAVFKFSADDLNELDFTVPGKTGSCNSCSLGDAFRCSTCPYIGLPAFEPGEEVKILSGLVQI
ncbi:anamorsin family protein [Niveomyces insectorum RCEF 264]|uniref:Anamorsin family protein n=1 Tax=Niveomyces insectorum RCEF 264 TaxID=1081102 RepID=A0A167RW09_9HYPO|nr:anamorsin family protein [Niveomyces insectorum RCEF 264]